MISNEIRMHLPFERETEEGMIRSMEQFGLEHLGGGNFGLKKITSWEEFYRLVGPPDRDMSILMSPQVMDILGLPTNWPAPPEITGDLVGITPTPKHEYLYGYFKPPVILRNFIYDDRTDTYTSPELVELSPEPERTRAQFRKHLHDLRRKGNKRCFKK